MLTAPFEVKTEYDHRRLKERYQPTAGTIPEAAANHPRACLPALARIQDLRNEASHCGSVTVASLRTGWS